MSREDKEKFISRWSRRKSDAAKEAAAPKPAAAAPEAKPELPSLESLKGLASEYKEFLRPGIDEKLRQAALKKLFRDPHFNVMDGLDTYIDDYSKPDPIPDAMLRTLAHAKRLLFDEEEKKNDEVAEQPAPPALPEAHGAQELKVATPEPAEKKDKV
jgi:hypothetical protein